jgi:hypothetical protein
MKKLLVTFCVIIIAVTMTVSATAGDKTLFGSKEKYDRAEASLLMGLQSDNEGLRESAAYMLGELKSEKAVIPLMSMLKCDGSQTSRVVAALALCRIGDARGSYAVKQAVQFDENRLVQHRCAWFYNEYVQAGTFAFRSEDGTTHIDLAIR